ncbi:MAG: LacI family DNA-binding transcriptional regulator [Pseudomonadota bacterium]
MKDNVTSSDVARRAGVSQSAVSRAFTPGASVSSTMRAKVLQAAEELDYRPNALARSLITQRSRIVGIALAYLDNQYYPMALEKLSRRLQDDGYHTMVFFALNKEPADALVATFLQYQVDAVILASCALSTPWVAACERAGVPVVLFNRSHIEPQFSAVTSDNVDGGRKVAEFLLAGGHERIGYIAGWEGASTQRDREAGFRAGLAAAGREHCARTVGDYADEPSRQAARAMFDRPAKERPDAVFVANDHMALIVMDVLRYELGLRIPQDVSVVGYDDVPQAAWPAYALTTLRQPVNRMVESTVRVLLERIERPDAPPERVEIKGPLMIRDSARVPAGFRQ